MPSGSQVWPAARGSFHRPEPEKRLLLYWRINWKKRTGVPDDFFPPQIQNERTGGVKTITGGWWLK